MQFTGLSFSDGYSRNYTSLKLFASLNSTESQTEESLENSYFVYKIANDFKYSSIENEDKTFNEWSVSVLFSNMLFPEVLKTEFFSSDQSAFSI